jgi:predicted secreted protein
MDPIMAVAIYIIWWWIALFMVLPIGVRNLDEAGVAPDGSERGAPERPNLKKKAIWASGLALIFWALTIAYVILDPFNVR